MAKLIKAKIVDAYDWECPGCGESNIDEKAEREAVHMSCNMDYISLKCSNCNGSYVVEESCGWLTAFRGVHGGRLDNLKKYGLPTKPNQIKYTREELTRREVGVAQCYLCGGHGTTAEKIIHDSRCAFSDPTVDHVFVGGRL